MSDQRPPQQRPDFAAPGEPSGGPGDWHPGQPPAATTTYPPQQPPPAAPRPGGYDPMQQPAPYGWPRQPAQPVQRPAMITLSVVLVVTGSLLWMTALGFVWLIAYVARDGFDYTGIEGGIYHMLARFHLRMLDGGLAIVFFGFPTAAVVLAFFLLSRRSWPRIAVTALGAAAVIIPAVLLRSGLSWVVPWAGYIAFSCSILWAPSVTRWIEGDRSPGRMSG